MGSGIGSRLAAAFLFGVAFVGLAGQARAAEPGAELTISVLTFGPGDHPFYKFGHNAILVHDALHARDDVYNYGTFDFRTPALIPDFLKGRLRYWLSVRSLEGTVEEYRSENRSITAQELALSPAKRRALADRLARNALPANRYYRYDYYGDNCSTRVRDAVDAELGGRLRAASTGPASFTFRGHTLRLTAGDLPVYLGLDVAMGDVVDRPITQWQEMFLPSKLQESLRRVTVTTPSGEVPLVERETVLLDANRPPLRESPPRWTLPMALVGGCVGAILTVLGRAAATRPSARVAFGVAVGALGAAAGLLGSIFVFFWAATDHVVAHHNENILQCSPLGLALAVFAVGLAMGNPRRASAAAAIAVLLAAGSLLGLALKVLPWFDQSNGQVIALLLPAWVGVAAGARYAMAGRLV